MIFKIPINIHDENWFRNNFFKARLKLHFNVDNSLFLTEYF